jgi:hypothetical protein
MAELKDWLIGVTIGISILIIIVGLIRGGMETRIEPPIEARGERLPDAVVTGLRVIFGGQFPDWMAYTYTIVPFLFLPFLGAFVLIFYLVRSIMPSRFAAPLAIIIVFITAYTGVFLRFVFGTLSTFGWYGYILVWCVLIISATAWGIGTIATGVKGIETKILKIEKEITKARKELEEILAEKAETARRLEEMRATAHPNPEAEGTLIQTMETLSKKAEKKEIEIKNSEELLRRFYAQIAEKYKKIAGEI